MMQLLELGCDCFGEIRYVDVVLYDMVGELYEILNVICIYEEDDGVLWKYVDYVEGVEVWCVWWFVIFFYVMVVNYEYFVYWWFY